MMMMHNDASPSQALSATARPHNSTLRSESFIPLRHFVCAVERPVAEEVVRGNILVYHCQNTAHFDPHIS
jgi:hypothetical protein